VTAAQKPGALQAAADAGKTILLNNMEGQRMGDGYVQETINGGFNFLQFLSTSTPPELPTSAQMTALHNAGIQANYYTSQIRGTLDATKKQYVRNMFGAAVDFPLVDDVPGGLSVAAEYAIAPVDPHYITNIHPAALGVNVIVNPGAETYMDDYHVPTTATLPTSGVLETRDRELTGWNDVVEATNAPYGGLYMPTSVQYPQGTFGKNLFISGIISGERWMEQTIDLGGLETEIDAGTIEYALSAWLGGYGNYDNYSALTAIFLDEDANALGSAQLLTQEHEDWSSMTGMVYLDDSGDVPLGSRSIEVRLSFERLTGGITNGMADNLSLVLIHVPEPSTWAINTDGNWFTPGNWIGDVPSGPRTTACFTGATPATVIVDSPVTVGGIIFDPGITGTNYTLSGSAITLDNSGGTGNGALIEVVSGSHSISSAIILNDNASITGTEILNLSGGISGSHTLTVLGGVTTPSIQVNTLVIGSAGALQTVPEPSTFALLGIGALSLLSYAWRRTKRR
jgi:hypothetical protein